MTTAIMNNPSLPHATRQCSYVLKVLKDVFSPATKPMPCVILGSALLLNAFAATTVIAPTPPMGWNSWDAYGTTVTETEVKANADYMAQKLRSHGWQYVVVDIQWSEPKPQVHGYRPNADLVMDEYGRLIPAPNRFPSATAGAGFTALAEYVHGHGLKFGIHIMRGIPRLAVAANLPVAGTQVHAADIADKTSVCRWNTDMYGVDMSKDGGQAYYDSIVKMYAGWGVDYIKADDMATPFHAAEIAALHNAILKSGRPIVLSLSPGPADVAKAAFYADNANLWRISGDFWDRWDALKENFALLNKWSVYTKPESWPDADMLPLGRIGIRAERGEDRRTRFTPDEQQTMMSLWSIARSPLMFGGDLPSNDEATYRLISNDEILQVNQHASNSHQLFANGAQIAWVSDAASSGAKYLAVFDVGDRGTEDIRVEWKDLGLSGECSVRDLWAKKDLGRANGRYTFKIGPHASGLYRIEAMVKK
ncbi:MAG: glycoside hydrolase family 27 protein [Bryobacteraceae bacterium]